MALTSLVEAIIEPSADLVGRIGDWSIDDGRFASTEDIAIAHAPELPLEVHNPDSVVPL